MPKKHHHCCAPPACDNPWTPPYPSYGGPVVNTLQGPPGPAGRDGRDGSMGPPGTQLSVGPSFPSTGTSKVGDVYISDSGIIYRFDGTVWQIEYMLPTRTHVLNSQFIFNSDSQVGSYLGLTSINGDFANVSVPIDTASVVIKFAARVTLGVAQSQNVIIRLQLWTGTGSGTNTASLGVLVKAGDTTGSATVSLNKSLNPFDGVSALYLGVTDGNGVEVFVASTKGVVISTTISYQAA